MGAYLILAFILLVGPLAVLYGKDSRLIGDDRGWWPGKPKRR